MADTHEAQLLSDLLRDLAREDACVDAAHLEARVMFTAEAAATVRLKPDSTYRRVRSRAVAAAVAVAVLLPTAFWLKTEVPVEKAQLKVDATEEVVAQESNAGGPANASGPAKVGRYVRPRIAQSPIAQSPIAQSAIAQSPIAQSSITQSREEFVPLMPMTEQELTGPFQIVRVQMPRASLGALRSPLEYPNELVEADVLLGEDGMARAIRVSAGGSVYPWRSR